MRRSSLLLVGALLVVAAAFAPTAFARSLEYNPTSACPPQLQQRHAFEDPLQDLQIDVQQNTQAAIYSLPRPTTYRPLSPEHIISDLEDKEECKSCIKGIAKHIISATYKKIEEVCEKGKECPFIKKRCDWIKDNKEEFTGYLVVTLRPEHDGFVYCLGNGSCHMNSSLSLADDNLWSVAAPVTELQLAQAEPILDRVLQKATAEDSNFLAWEPRENTLSPSVSSGGRCAKCLNGSIKWILKRAEYKLRMTCAHTKCEKLKKFCEWAKEHKEFVRGMLYGKIQPWKHATGWCAGKGKCGARGASEEEEGEAHTLPYFPQEEVHNSMKHSKKHGKHHSKVHKAVDKAKKWSGATADKVKSIFDKFRRNKHD